MTEKQNIKVREAKAQRREFIWQNKKDDTLVCEVHVPLKVERTPSPPLLVTLAQDLLTATLFAGTVGRLYYSLLQQLGLDARISVSQDVR